MKALMKVRPGPGGMELRDRPRPEPQPDWVVLRVLGTGICGTDLHIRDGRAPCSPPLILGHEFAGEVVDLGEGVHDWRPGQRVVCEPHAGACGRCTLCHRGLMQHCTHKGAPGIAFDGALADYVAVPAHLLHRVPDTVDDRAAAVCEPTAVAVTAIERVGLQPAESVVVFGPGPVGLLVAMGAAACGASSVAVVGRTSSASRLKVAADLGIDVWNSDDVDVVTRAHDEIGPDGVDVVVDASGGADAIDRGVAMLRRRGRMCAIGLSGTETIAFPWDQAMFQAIDLVFSMSSSYTSWERSLDLLASGAVRAAALTTTFPLSDWETAFDRVEERSVVKALLVP